MEQLTGFNIVVIVFTLAAVCGYINHRWMRLPTTIGLVVIALVVSLCVILLDIVLNTLEYERSIRVVLERIDFDDTLMKGMLSFLLFAGALHVNLNDLLSRVWAITAMATAGVLISTFIVGYAIFLIAAALGIDIPLLWCLVFGALISPTDPVAVLGMLKTIHVPKSLEAKIAGESLFNDGVGVVVFILMVAVASSAGGVGEPITALDVVELFALEALGGGLLGLVAGYIAYRAMKSIDEYNLEVIITLALVTLTYSIGLAIHVSGPIAVVVAGLLIGNHGTRYAMSDKTREHIETFWSLTDEILNAALFLLIGFEVLVITFAVDLAWLTLAAIPVVLFARFVAVATPLTLLGLRRDFTNGAVPTLVWGGLRGGISVALALSLPDIPEKPTILAVTYGVVVFSIIVQGLTFKSVVRRYVRDS
ncbi:MAG: sodium:proton antiporter [Alphaproteobacteria bacterium]|nr:sodium:proton antiporter [Alphaproteobacteria bacterium]